MSAPYDIRTVEHLGGYKLQIGFADGSVRIVDLEAKLSGAVGPMLEPLKDVAFFAQACVDAATGSLRWPNGADIAPDALRAGTYDAIPAA